VYVCGTSGSLIADEQFLVFSIVISGTSAYSQGHDLIHLVIDGSTASLRTSVLPRWLGRFGLFLLNMRVCNQQFNFAR
jgi:hypothetical protein